MHEVAERDLVLLAVGFVHVGELVPAEKRVAMADDRHQSDIALGCDLAFSDPLRKGFPALLHEKCVLCDALVFVLRQRFFGL